MEIPENLLCLFTAEVKTQDGSYVVELPKDEFDVGQMRRNETYRVAILPTQAPSEAESPPEPDREPGRASSAPEPPVEEGEIREVEIEDIGEQGDGIARVERGYVIIVPDTEVDETATIEITNVRENVAFGEPIDEE